MALALALWVVSASLAPLLVFALAFGVFYGGWVAVMPSVVMDQFGGRNVSSIIGVLYTSVAFGTLIGPSAAGFAFDVSGSYTVPILASLAANVLAALILVVAEARVAARAAAPAA
jgi:MFS family permease